VLLMEYLEEGAVNKVAQELLDGRSCQLAQELRSMNIDQQYDLLTQATKLANSRLNKDKFSLYATSHSERLGDFVDVHLYKQIIPFLGNEIFGASHQLGSKNTKYSCSEK
jgi:hypothetical protein